MWATQHIRSTFFYHLMNIHKQNGLELNTEENVMWRGGSAVVYEQV